MKIAKDAETTLNTMKVKKNKMKSHSEWIIRKLASPFILIAAYIFYWTKIRSQKIILRGYRMNKTFKVIMNSILISTTALFCYNMADTYWMHNKTTLMCFDFGAKKGIPYLIDKTEPYGAIITLLMLPIYLILLIKEMKKEMEQEE